MRELELKFRAWNGTEMLYQDTSLYKYWKETRWVHGDEAAGWHNGASSTEGHILMQYTGLKDKNGKEIYEGDIVRKKFSYSNLVVDDIQVIEDIRMMSDDLDILQLAFNMDSSNDDIEVIGNIYENSELAKDV